MKRWYIVTLVGKDQPGIVAEVSEALFAAGCQLGEASMARLGDSFTIMMMVQSEETMDALQARLAGPVAHLNLHAHIDEVETGLHRHVEPDLRLSVFGADRPGIVARVTRILADSRFNVLHLETDVAGSASAPIYIMHIEGRSEDGIDALRERLVALRSEGIDVSLEEIDTLIG